MAITNGYRLARDAAVLSALAIVFALLGPFGTYAQPMGWRLLNWLVFIVGGYLCFRPIIFASDALSRVSGLPFWATRAPASLVASFPVTILVALWLAGPRWREVRFSALAELYPMVLLIGAAMIAVYSLVERRDPVTAQTEAASTVPEPAGEDVDGNPLFDRLPPALGRGVLCVKNEDHYVMIFTRHGNALILLRLSDAVAALEQFEGAQVHRSWWVARGAIAGAQRQGRSLFLQLVNGEHVPVSRSMAATLRSDGWI